MTSLVQTAPAVPLFSDGRIIGSGECCATGSARRGSGCGVAGGGKTPTARRRHPATRRRISRWLSRRGMTDLQLHHYLPCFVFYHDRYCCLPGPRCSLSVLAEPAGCSKCNSVAIPCCRSCHIQVAELTAAGADGFAIPFGDLPALAEAADPVGARESPEDCVASVLGALRPPPWCQYCADLTSQVANHAHACNTPRQDVSIPASQNTCICISTPACTTMPGTKLLLTDTSCFG